MHALRARFSQWFINTFVPAVFPRVNPLARWLLGSPLHPLASWYVMSLRFRGRRTGRAYDMPVVYHRTGDGVFEAITSRRGVWWRNLRGATGVTVLLRGRDLPAWVEVVEDDLDVIDHALGARDVVRRLLVTVPPGDGVLLRVHVPSAAAPASRLWG